MNVVARLENGTSETQQSLPQGSGLPLSEPPPPPSWLPTPARLTPYRPSVLALPLPSSPFIRSFLREGWESRLSLGARVPRPRRKEGAVNFPGSLRAGVGRDDGSQAGAPGLAWDLRRGAGGCGREAEATGLRPVRVGLGGLSEMGAGEAGCLHSRVEGRAFFARFPARPRLEATSRGPLAPLVPHGGDRRTTCLGDIRASSGSHSAYPEGICAVLGLCLG